MLICTSLSSGGVTVLVISSLVYLISRVMLEWIHTAFIGLKCLFESGTRNFLPVRKNYERKEGIGIVQITQNECFELRKLGHRFGSEGTLHKTRSHHPPKYYLTESRAAMKDLETIRGYGMAK